MRKITKNTCRTLTIYIRYLEPIDIITSFTEIKVIIKRSSGNFHKANVSCQTKLFKYLTNIADKNAEYGGYLSAGLQFFRVRAVTHGL